MKTIAESQVIERRIGVNFNDNRAEIRIWAPTARKADICINNKVRISLLKQDRGYWALSTQKLQPGDRYLFILDGEKWLPDPASLSQPEGVHEASEALDISGFHWSDWQWKNPALEDYIFYELHTGAFTPEGTFEAIGKKLSYLRDLGITAIELMPVGAFPGTRNWGYDGVFPFAVHQAYGGARALQELVNLCHREGFAVVMDVVYNHLGPEGNYLPEYGPYFTDKYKTPWGSAINYDDADCDGVRHYFAENALMWLRDFHIDALRLDAVHAIKDLSPVHILREIRQRVDELSASTGKTYYLISECDLNDPRYIDPTDKQGYGMDAQWCDEFHHALRVAAGQEATGYYEDFNGIPHLAKAYRNAYVYDGQYSKHRRKIFGMKLNENPGKQFVVFSQNHDQVGNRMLGERTSTLLSFEMQKLLAGAVMVSPYLPLLFMGEEWSEAHPFMFFADHGNPELKEAVRKGRSEEFKAFQLSANVPDPFSESTFESSRLQWELLQKEPHQTMFRYYRQLITVRKQYFQGFNRRQLSVSYNTDAQTLQLERWLGDRRIVCVMNFSGEPQKLTVPKTEKLWHKLIDSADAAWLGPACSHNELVAGAEIAVQPESILVFINHV